MGQSERHQRTTPTGARAIPPARKAARSRYEGPVVRRRLTSFPFCAVASTLPDGLAAWNESQEATGARSRRLLRRWRRAGSRHRSPERRRSAPPDRNIPRTRAARAHVHPVSSSQRTRSSLAPTARSHSSCVPVDVHRADVVIRQRALRRVDVGVRCVLLHHPRTIAREPIHGTRARVATDREPVDRESDLMSRGQQRTSRRQRNGWAVRQAHPRRVAPDAL